MARPTSSLATAVDAVLKVHGTTLEAWLDEAGNSGRPLRDLAFEIRTQTGVPVSHETLRRWMQPERGAA